MAQNDEFLLNSACVGGQTSRGVAGLTIGDFVAVWRSGDGTQRGDRHAIRSRLFNSNGVEKKVNSS